MRQKVLENENQKNSFLVVRMYADSYMSLTLES